MSAPVLFIVTLLFWFSLYAYTSYVGPELERMGATASFVGVVGSAYGFTQLLLRLPVGIMADKWQKKFFICCGGFCSGAAALCMLLFYHPIAFLIGRALAGVAASSWVTFTILYSSYFKAADAAKSITMLSMANATGQLFSFLVAGFFVARFGPRAAFAVSVAGGFTAFGLSLLVHEEPSPPGKVPLRLKDLLTVATDRHLLTCSLLAALVQTIATSTAMIFSGIHAKSIGATPAQLSYMSVFVVLAALTLNFTTSRFLLQRVRTRWLALAGFSCFIIYCFGLPQTTAITQVYCLQLFAGAGNALTISLLMGACVRDIPTDRRSAAMGFYQAVYGLGMTSGPAIMGFLSDLWGLNTGFAVMGSLALLGTIPCVLFLREKRVEPAHTRNSAR